jgi:hypothetical protein
MLLGGCQLCATNAIGGVAAREIGYVRPTTMNWAKFAPAIVRDEAEPRVRMSM